MLSLEDESIVQQCIDQLRRAPTTDKKQGLTITRQYWMAKKLKELNSEVKDLQIQLANTDEVYGKAINDSICLQEQLDALKLKYDQATGAA